jgi:hypothetical protein
VQGAGFLLLRRGVIAVMLAALLAVGCRTSRPQAGDVPLVAGTPLTSIHGIRTLMRVRTMSAGQTQSFRAQLVVEPSTRRMQLDAYTPLGTTAATLFADGDRVVFLDHLNRTAWKGDARQLSESVRMLGQTAPADWALGIAGYLQLPAEALRIEYLGEDGARLQNIIPPAKHVQVFGAGDSVPLADIVNLEVYATEASLTEPWIPADYRCCVQPRM